MHELKIYYILIFAVFTVRSVVFRGNRDIEFASMDNNKSGSNRGSSRFLCDSTSLIEDRGLEREARERLVSFSNNAIIAARRSVIFSFLIFLRHALQSPIVFQIVLLFPFVDENCFVVKITRSIENFVDNN